MKATNEIDQNDVDEALAGASGNGVSEIDLPDGDGWQLLQRLRDAPVALPGYAIAMSGYGMNADRSKSKAAGYSQHILKPFKASELQAMLTEAAHALDA